MKSKLFGLLLSAMATVNVFAGVKVVVFSDPHVINGALVGPNVWKEKVQSDRKMLDYSVPLLDAMIEKIRKDIKPDVVLITGDLTEDGSILSHKIIADKLTALSKELFCVSVIPGNHDYERFIKVDFDSDQQTRAAVDVASKMDVGKMKEMYSAAGYGPDSYLCGNTLTYMREISPKLVLLSIDTGKEGLIGDNTLSWIKKEVSGAVDKGKKVIAMMHHPLVPHFNGADLFADNAVVKNWENVRDVLCNAGVKVVLSGHFHSSDIATDFNADLSKSIVDISTGSLAAYPCHYRVLEFSDNLASVHVSTGSITEIEGVENFPSVAKERLRSSTEKYISGLDNILHIMPTSAANALICHNEGNEDSNPEAQRTLDNIFNLTSMARELGIWNDDQLSMAENVASSLLRDLSHYGDSERENKTDDLNLDIKLENNDTAVDDIQADTADFSVYDMAGRKVQVLHPGIYIVKSNQKTYKVLR